MNILEGNPWCTTDLTLNIMDHCARRLGLDVEDKRVADSLYAVCCDLENWPEGCGFGSSDHYAYTEQARKDFHIPEEIPSNY